MGALSRRLGLALALAAVARSGPTPPPAAAWPLMLEEARKDPIAWLAVARAMPEDRELMRLMIEGLANGDAATQERALESALAIEASDWRIAGRTLLDLVGEGLDEPDRSIVLETLEGIASRRIPCPAPPGLMRISPGCRPDLAELLPAGPTRVRRRARKAIAAACLP